MPSEDNRMYHVTYIQFAKFGPDELGLILPYRSWVRMESRRQNFVSVILVANLSASVLALQ
jgi:hypothetical protein